MASNGELQNICGICLSHFTEPKILACFHTFCMKCLEDNLRVTGQSERFTCPTCRTDTPIPTGGVKSFQTNFYVTNRFSWKSDFDCDTCDNSTTARYNCKECNQNFCEVCSKIHLRMSSSKDHSLKQLLPVEHMNPSRGHAKVCCIKHPREELAMVCKDCKEIVCQACKATLHNEHSCSDVSVQARETRQKLREHICLSEDNLREIENDILVVKKQAEAKQTFFNEQMTALRKDKDALISKINEKFKNFEEEIKRINVEQKMLSNEIIEKEMLKTTNFKHTIDQSKEMFETAEDLTVLMNFDNLVDKLNEIKFTLTPAVSGHSLMENVETCTSWLIKLNETNNKM